MPAPKSSPRRYRRRVSSTRRERTRQIALGNRRWLLSLARDSVELARMVHFSVRPTDVVLFIGRGMRPVFDAYTHYKFHSSLNDRRRVRFFMTPAQANPLFPTDMHHLSQSLQRMKIIPSRPSRFVIVDYYFAGGTYRALSRAIRSLSPASHVVMWHTLLPVSSQRKADDMLHEVDRHPRPTTKGADGSNDGSPNSISRLEFLYLSRAIRRLAYSSRERLV